jgi:S1-C subfamily serine protease
MKAMGSSIGFLSLLAIAASGLHAQQVHTSELERSVAQVVVRHADGSSKAFGTAFFVRDDGTLATVNHVYAQAIAYIAQARDGQIAVRRMLRGATTGLLASVDLISTDSLHDLAIIRVHEFSRGQWTDFGGTTSVTISQRTEVPMRSALEFIGYFGDDLLPETLSATLSGTTTMTVQPRNSAVEELLISGFAWPGHSGSPVFLEGEVIGLVDSIVTVPVAFNPQPLHSGVNRVVKAEHLRSLLSAVK